MVEIITILIADIGAIYYADLLAKKDASATYAFGGLVTLTRKDGGVVDIKKHQAGIHRQNFKAIIFICALIATAAFFVLDAYVKPSLIFVNSGFAYWLWFDINLSRRLGKGNWYLGFTSKTDQKASKLFKTGKTKAIICVVAIAVIHVVYFLC